MVVYFTCLCLCDKPCFICSELDYGSMEPGQPANDKTSLQASVLISVHELLTVKHVGTGKECQSADQFTGAYIVTSDHGSLECYKGESETVHVRDVTFAQDIIGSASVRTGRLSSTYGFIYTVYRYNG